MEEIESRRTEELEATHAYYGEDLLPSLNSGHEPSAVSTPSQEAAPPNASLSHNVNGIPLDGPWFLRIRHRQGVEEVNDQSSSIGEPTLEIRLPASYPLGDECPTPILHNVMMNPKLKDDLLQELKDMYSAEVEVAILWGERCREELLCGDSISMNGTENDSDHVDAINGASTTSQEISNNDAQIRTFIPPTTRYSQPIRNFPLDVISNPTYQRKIIRTPPFHPPKSGPSEILIAHVCSVTCMEHVQWVLAELLFNDKKVGKATHNMFAYRFSKDGMSVSDNDDDGEKGSGAKLAALLQMCNVDNVFVVVSRWFGGVLLGPARFKHIAGIARDGLVQAGFVGESDK